jgi:hypothetical protein
VTYQDEAAHLPGESSGRGALSCAGPPLAAQGR